MWQVAAEFFAQLTSMGACHHRSVQSKMAPSRQQLIFSAESVIGGTLVCASVIAAGAKYYSSTAKLTIAIVVTVVVFWLAHVHAEVLGSSLAEGKHPVRMLVHVVAHTWPFVAVSLLPVSILVVADAAGTGLMQAATIALYATTVLVALYSYLAGRRGGLSVRASLAAAVAGAMLGLIIVAMKALLK